MITTNVSAKQTLVMLSERSAKPMEMTALNATLMKIVMTHLPLFVTQKIILVSPVPVILNVLMMDLWDSTNKDTCAKLLIALDASLVKLIAIANSINGELDVKPMRIAMLKEDALLLFVSLNGHFNLFVLLEETVPNVPQTVTVEATNTVLKEFAETVLKMPNVLRKE